ncbi:MAG TPA: peroxiredoxin [Pyrinomonadaceae bacterium]|jgi:peroxiredoxin Q/BCP
MAVETEQRFVDFSLQNQDGKTVKLDDFAGKWLVVYVYPKDDTPGCTMQGKAFTATKQEFDDAGIAVVGVSADDVASHKDFCNKFSFTIDLLADPNQELLKTAGVGQSEYKGTMYWNRTSFVIDPEGNLRKVYEKVNPEGHERMLLDDIKAMQATG